MKTRPVEVDVDQVRALEGLVIVFEEAGTPASVESLVAMAIDGFVSGAEGFMKETHQ